ncbi:MAG: DUF6145 family protein [Lachnospiraceae bacterium]|nr:DUF6145 family protein [Lachnospiraceae bacterium]
MDTFEKDNRCVLCGASAYEKKYYFNPEFGKLPDQVKETLQIICVEFAEKCGGVFTVEFDSDGDLKLVTDAEEVDAMYDDIGAELEIKNLRRTQAELFEELTLFYRVVFLGEKIEL